MEEKTNGSRSETKQDAKMSDVPLATDAHGGGNAGSRKEMPCRRTGRHHRWTGRYAQGGSGSGDAMKVQIDNAEYRFFFRYERDRHGHPKSVTCVIVSGESAAYGTARCHKMDKWDRQAGRRLALTRALDDGRFARACRLKFWEEYNRHCVPNPCTLTLTMPPAIREAIKTGVPWGIEYAAGSVSFHVADHSIPLHPA